MGRHPSAEVQVYNRRRVYCSGVALAGAVTSVIAIAVWDTAWKIVPVVFVPNARVPPPASGVAVAL